VIEAASIVSMVVSGTSVVPQLDGKPADAEIRSQAVNAAVPRVARMHSVRMWVNERVKQVARERNVVVDGRDMGTAVFPQADVKIYLVADTWERAKRRLVQHLKRLPTDDEIAA
jgi:cytidylate kinase